MKLNSMIQPHPSLICPSGCYCLPARPRRVCRSSANERNGSSDGRLFGGHDPESGSGFDKLDPLQPQQGQEQAAWGSSWTKRGSGGSRSLSSQQSYFTKKPSTLGSEIHPSSGESSSSSSSHRSMHAQSAADPPALDPHLQASIHKNVDQAAEMLQEIVNEVLNEVLLEEASAFVMGQDRSGERLPLTQAARGAVVKRLDWLDSNFLAALNAYLTLPAVRADEDLLALLTAIRHEVLELVAARLPPSVQVLNSALTSVKREGRLQVVDISLKGGADNVPGCSLDALGAAATQLVDDMEDQQVVADRVLLARMVLLREELRAVAESQTTSGQDWWGGSSNISGTDTASPNSGNADDRDNPSAESKETSNHSHDADGLAGNGSKFFSFHRSNLPVRCAAFVKELLAVKEQQRRLGLLSKAFQEDWVGEKSSSKAMGADDQEHQPSSAPQPRRGLQDIRQASEEQREDAPDVVRPGRFFSTLHAMKTELEQQASAMDVSGAAQTLALLSQLDQVRREGLVALDRLQRQGSNNSNFSRLSEANLEPGAAASENHGVDYQLDIVT